MPPEHTAPEPLAPPGQPITAAALRSRLLRVADMVTACALVGPVITELRAITDELQRYDDARAHAQRLEQIEPDPATGG